MGSTRQKALAIFPDRCREKNLLACRMLATRRLRTTTLARKAKDEHGEEQKDR
jgi:hypothetical protein